MFRTGTPFGAFLLAGLVMIPQSPAWAFDVQKCIAIRDELRKAHESQDAATARLGELKQRAESLSKQIDDASIQEADEYLTGRTNPDTERRLTQLRAEYRAVTQGTEYRELQATMKKTKDIIAVYEAKRQREGCPPDTSSAASDSSGGLEGPFEHEITFQDDTKNATILMKTLKDYNGLSISGKLGFLGMSSVLSITCAPTDVVFMTYHRPHTYDCDFSRQIGDPTGKLVSSQQGKAQVKLTLERDHKSQLVIDLRPGAVVKDLSHTPPVTTRSKDSEITLWEEIAFK